MNREKNANRRLFDRINVTGAISVAGKHYRIIDISVGGVAVQGPILKSEPGNIIRVQFALCHGNLYVSGKVNCLYIGSSANSIARLKFIDPEEDLTEFFRAATLRSVSGSEYSVGWLAETSAQLPVSQVKSRRSFLSRFLSLPMLLAVMIVFVPLLLAIYEDQVTSSTNRQMFKSRVLIQLKDHDRSRGSLYFSMITGMVILCEQDS